MKRRSRRRSKGGKPIKKGQVLILLLASALAIITFYYVSAQYQEERRAAILDGLSTDLPNKTFTAAVVDILTRAGYRVDIYESDEVTLELFRELPSKGYDIVILRLHGGRIRQPAGIYLGSGLFLEKCSISDAAEKLGTGYLLLGRPFFSNETYCVAPPQYVEEKLSGYFRDTLIISMACFTGDDEAMANAFFRRGAKAYVGFKGIVSSSYVDSFTETLLRKIYLDNKKLAEAFAETRKTTGQDPLYGGEPVIYLR